MDGSAVCAECTRVHCSKRTALDTKGAPGRESDRAQLANSSSESYSRRAKFLAASLSMDLGAVRSKLRLL